MELLEGRQRFITRIVSDPAQLGSDLAKQERIAAGETMAGCDEPVSRARPERVRQQLRARSERERAQRDRLGAACEYCQSPVGTGFAKPSACANDNG
jgi:hypothetical protein